MESFHGTLQAAAAHLATGAVDVTLGGGELGRGFYSGQYLHQAKAWAAHKSRGMEKQLNVVSFSVTETDLWQLNIVPLDRIAAVANCIKIKRQDSTRTFQFEADLVWAPIVGTGRINGDQYKWESALAQLLLNGAQVVRGLI